MGCLPCPGRDTSVAHTYLLLTKFYLKVAGNSTDCHLNRPPSVYTPGGLLGLMQIVPQTVPERIRIRGKCLIGVISCSSYPFLYMRDLVFPSVLSPSSMNLFGETRTNREGSRWRRNYITTLARLSLPLYSLCLSGSFSIGWLTCIPGYLDHPVSLLETFW